MSLQKTQIDFDWAYCQLLCLEHDAITEMLDELYPEVSENEEFIHEFNVALTHWQLIELKSFAAEIESQMKEFPSGTSATEKITSLADFFTEYEQYRVESLNSLIESGDVEIVEGHAEISFFHQLLPLFFSFDLKTKSGALLKSVKTREIVFKAYHKALKESGKNLSGVKTSYKE